MAAAHTCCLARLADRGSAGGQRCKSLAFSSLPCGHTAVVREDRERCSLARVCLLLVRLVDSGLGLLVG